MLELEEAQSLTLRSVARMAAVATGLDDAVGLVLAEDVVADVDAPQFDKSAMDGFAVRAADVAQLPATLAVTETIPAGRVPEHQVGPGQAARIMTGAPIPAGADTVVMVEHTSPAEAAGEVERVCIERAPKVGTNIRRRGEDIQRGTAVLAAGTRLRPAEIALIAALGQARPKVFKRPTVAVLATGDEVVEPDQPLSGAQIHNSNSPAGCARLRQLGVPARWTAGSCWGSHWRCQCLERKYRLSRQLGGLP